MPTIPAVLAQTDPYASDGWIGLYELGWGLEAPLAFVCAAIALWGAYKFFPLGLHRLFTVAPNPGMGLVRAAFLFAVFWFWLVLQTGAASDIVGFYTFLYVAFSLAVLFVAGFWPTILGLYYPADVIERGNLAAGLVYAGFVLGTAFAFGGALTGEGPGWWVVFVFFVLAYVELRANMSLVARLSGRLQDDVRLERDASAGLLLGAVAVASGLVSGAAAAGDFHGWAVDLDDYLIKLWPLLAIAAVGAGVGAYSRLKEDPLASRAIASVVLVASGLVYYVWIVVL